MAILKPLSGHKTLAENTTRDYLLGIGRFESKYGGNRAQHITYIGLEPDAPHMPSWDKRMDEDRRLWKTDIPYRNKPVRTYNHYMFSPCPTDNITVEELNKALKEWCERIFQNKFDIVIVYHNDNNNKVQHAHMIINNVNHDISDKYRRVSSYVTPQCWEYASQLWQYMCKQRGWYSFIDKQKADVENATDPDLNAIAHETDNFTKQTENAFKIDEQYFETYKHFNHSLNYRRPYSRVQNAGSKALKRPFATKNGRNYTNGARQAKEQGKHLWTDDIRDLIEISYYQSSNVQEFMRQLAGYGVVVEITQNKDFKYSHPTNTEWRVTGAKLGRDYTRRSIYSKFSNTNSAGDYKCSPNSSFNSKISKKVQALVTNTQVTHISIKEDNECKLEEVATLLRVCSEYNLWSIDEIKAALPLASTSKETHTLSSALNTFVKLENIDTAALKDIAVAGVSQSQNPINKANTIKPNSINHTYKRDSLRKHKDKGANRENRHSLQKRSDRSAHDNRSYRSSGHTSR